LACECGVVGGDAHGEGYGGPEAQDFGTDGVQVVAVVDVCGGDLVLDGGKVGTDFCAQLGLD
jgi:hypothetical protein